MDFLGSEGNGEMTSKTSSFESILSSNKQKISDIEKLKNSVIGGGKRNILFVVMTVVLFGFTSMFALQIISGIFAAVLAVVVGLVGFYGTRILKQFDPVFQQKLKNKKIELMVSEARENAVFQLDNQVIENRQRLADGREARDKMGAQIEMLRSQLKPENEGKPIYERKKKILLRLEKAYSQIKSNVNKAARANTAFEKKVHDYKEMEKFASAAAEAMALFSTSGDDKLEEILSMEAFGQIESDFNEALIEIENSASDMALDTGDN